MKKLSAAVLAFAFVSIASSAIAACPGAHATVADTSPVAVPPVVDKG